MIPVQRCVETCNYNFPYVLEKNVFSVIVGCKVQYISIRLSFKYFVLTDFLGLFDLLLRVVLKSSY